MRICYIVNYIHINGGWSPWDARIGGSEEMVVETSKRLAQRGHEVSVFHNGQHGTYEGVEYKDHEDFDGGDIVINLNFPEFKCDTPQILWTSLTQHPDLSHFKAVCYISEYAKENTGIVHDNLFWIPPGYDPEKIYPGKKVAKQCFYASSPDRGLNTLLEAWPKVHEAHPDATLIVTYGADVDVPGVINLGQVDEDTMNEIYRSSDIWCHPCNGGELYCMTGVKAQVAGCIPVIIPTMALAETVPYAICSDDADGYAGVLNAVIDNDILKENVRINQSGIHYPTWKDSTDKLEEVISSVLERSKI